MYTYIGIESITANALIELGEKKDKSEVSFDNLVRYGMRVVSILQEQTNNEVIPLLSRRYQINMIENYPDFFEADYSGGGSGVFRLKKSNQPEILRELKEFFRWTLNIQILEAFLSDEALHVLGVND